MVDISLEFSAWWYQISSPGATGTDVAIIARSGRTLMIDLRCMVNNDLQWEGYLWVRRNDGDVWRCDGAVVGFKDQEDFSTLI
jgi:hypothetical protein